MNLRKRTADRRHRWDDWVPQERLRKLTEENKELATNLKKDMDAQRRANSGKPPSMTMTGKKRPFGSDLTASSARGSEDRSSVAPMPPRGTKRGREMEGIDKASDFAFLPDSHHYSERASFAPAASSDYPLRNTSKTLQHGGHADFPNLKPSRYRTVRADR